MTTTHDSLVGLRSPALIGGNWLGNNPVSLAEAQTRGQPVLIHFWAASCDQSRKTLPQLARWWQAYQHQGLVIVGIHTPHLPFEDDPAVVTRTMYELAISWPIVHDSDRTNWQAFDNQYWPRYILVDASGTIVLDQIGEGNDEAIEAAIQLLLTSRGAQQLPEILPAKHQHKLGLTCYPMSPETQLGYQRGTFKNRRVVANKSTHYSDPKLPRQPGVALDGIWKVAADSVAHTPIEPSTPGTIAVTFSGFEAVFIGDTRNNQPIELVVTLNGHPIPRGYRGKAIKEEHGQTIALITSPGPYQLIRTQSYLSPAELRLTDHGGQLIAYTFQFSGCQED